VTHFEGVHSADTVMDVVADSEDSFLADRIQEMENAKNGLLQVQEKITSKNIFDVLVVLQEPAPDTIVKLESKGVDTRGILNFEIEGRYCLPKVDAHTRLEAICNQISDWPSEEVCQTRLILRVLELAEITLNEMGDLPLGVSVSIQPKLTHL
jgi:hypothetical protein